MSHEDQRGLKVLASLTVGICAYNEAWNMEKLLNNLIHEQNLPPDAEVVVVCSGCTDNTPRIVEYFEKIDPRIRLIEEPVRLGKAKAVNEILFESRGKNIIFLSADVTPKPDCLMALARAMHDPTIGVSCGKPSPIKRGSAPIRGLVETLWGFHNWQLERLNHLGLLMHASEVFCIRKELIHKIPEDMVNDDAFLAVATKIQGYKIKYVGNSQVDIYGPQTFSDYLKQRRRIIAGHYQVRQATGKFSAYILYGMLARPRLTVRLVVEYLAATRQIKSGLTLAIVEIVANLMAALDVMRGKSHSIWSVCRSTKTSRVL
jgi:cellulose synthase/poly-beta-1,6-N-acetylglucosamine synthase-like glycosyltransferase